MRFLQGMQVLTSDGKELGQLEQVVMDPQSKTVSHIVVKKGFLFTEDKLVPLNLIAMLNEDKVYLREDAGELEDLPPFEETHYLALDEIERGELDYPNTQLLYWVPPTNAWLAYPGALSVPPPYPSETSQNIPEGTVALREDAEVYSNHEELLGHVEEVLTDTNTNRINYFVVSMRGLMPEKRMIPMNWVREIYEDRILLNVGKSMVERLKEYHPEH